MQPDISPLARRLAEENNVKWQGLYGSGSEGRIVERDVLEYLARVMAGEEDLNPTAEPLPAGMDAWPEEDLTAANITATKTAAPTPQVTLTPVKSYDLMAGDMLADDMLADDLGVDDFASVSASATEADDALDLDLTFEAAPAASTPSGNVTPQDGAEAVDDDMFLFDDAFDDEATFTADAAQEDVLTFTAATQLEAVDFDLDSDESDAFDVLADDLQALELETDDVETEDVSFEAVLAAAPTPADVQDVALFAESLESDAPAEDDTDVSLFLSDETASDDTDVEADAVAGFEEVEVTEVGATEVGATEVATLEADSDDDEDTGLGAADAFDTSMDADMVDADTVDADTADAETVAAEAETDTARTTDSAAKMDAVAPAYSAPAYSDADADVTTPYEAPYEPPQAVPSTFVAAATSPQLVSYGLLLRRRVDLTKLMAAQVSIGQELGQDGPVAPNSLLLRAAAKTLLTLPLNEHQNVGLAVFGDRGVQLATMNDVTTRPFRDIVAAAAQPQVNTTAFGTTDFGVVVADMSDFDIDEAVLNAGAPVLTLGRILSDNTEGSHHSTLALSGEMTVEQGTKFLAVVADLLDAPIRLVI